MSSSVFTPSSSAPNASTASGSYSGSVRQAPGASAVGADLDRSKDRRCRDTVCGRLAPCAAASAGRAA